MHTNMHTKYVAMCACLEIIYCHILPRFELRCWIGLEPFSAILCPHGKAPYQKPGVMMVDSPHSTTKQIAQGFLLKNLVRLEVHPGLGLKYVSISEIR